MWRHVEVEISGHSLGGALSTLAAAELEALGFRVASVSTFGSPRVGDQVFASFIGGKFGDRMRRWTHAHDVVPSLPPRVLGYHHVPTEVVQTSELLEPQSRHSRPPTNHLRRKLRNY